MDVTDYDLFIKWLWEMFGMSEENFSSLGPELTIMFNRAWTKYKLDYTE